MLTLTLVIPVFNEEHQIKGCLESIAAQSVMPDEVIVVDNNCSDSTISLAQKFPFVRIISEPKQGRGHARSAGFNVAESDIFGRIDADSRLDSHWVERVKARFDQDAELAGLTGLGKTSFIPGVQWIKTTLFSRSYYWFVHSAFRTITMWGATMAITRKAWAEVSGKVCKDDSLVHEDQDLSLWIAASGGKIVQDNRVLITTSGQTYRYLPKIMAYKRLFEQTKDIHTKNGNLKSKISLLPVSTTLHGLIWSVILGVLLFAFSALLFPIDYIIARKLRRTDWIE